MTWGGVPQAPVVTWGGVAKPPVVPRGVGVGPHPWDGLLERDNYKLISTLGMCEHQGHASTTWLARTSLTVGSRAWHTIRRLQSSKSKIEVFVHHSA